MSLAHKYVNLKEPCNQDIKEQVTTIIKKKKKKTKRNQNFMAPFYGWGSTASRLEPLRGGNLFL